MMTRSVGFSLPSTRLRVSPMRNGSGGFGSDVWKSCQRLLVGPCALDDHFGILYSRSITYVPCAKPFGISVRSRRMIEPSLAARNSYVPVLYAATSRGL